MEPAALACPKCGAERRADATSCRKCGLAVDKMAAFAKSRDDVPEKLVAAWERAAAAWSDQSAHDEVLRLAHTLDAYPWVAAKYRGRAGDPIGDAQLARIQKAIEVTLLASATPKPEQGASRYRGLIAVVALIVLASMLLYVVIRLRDKPPEPTPPPVETK